jgi:ABC-2 type transport system permease protein
MRNTLAIARKELGIYFTTPWAWVVLAATLGLASFFFLLGLEGFQQVQEYAKQVGWARMPPHLQAYRNLTDGVIVPLWGVMLIVTLFIAPFLSMRLFAEERRQKTFELLMTAPVRPIEIVLGKYLGGAAVIASTLGMTLVFPIVLAVFGSGESGTAVEWSTVLLGYGALLLWGLTCMAVGMFLSSLTESQMIAAFLTFAVLLPWMLLDGAAQAADEPLRSIAAYISFEHQLSRLRAGVMELKALVFFPSVIALFIFVTHRRVEAFRWT